MWKDLWYGKEKWGGVKAIKDTSTLEKWLTENAVKMQER